MEMPRFLRVGAYAIASMAVAGSFAGRAEAQPVCSVCYPAYESCVASGATDCDTRYAVCLRYCSGPDGARLESKLGLPAYVMSPAARRVDILENRDQGRKQTPARS